MKQRNVPPDMTRSAQSQCKSLFQTWIRSQKNGALRWHNLGNYPSMDRLIYLKDS